ncbi:MAG: hypothetical protein AB7K09_06645 [Planctomycetota bacterium]
MAHTRRVHPRTALLALVVAALLGVLTSTASAEFLRLADGSVMQGEITAHDDLGITLRRLDNGGIIRLRWSQLWSEDRDRLRKQYGLELPDFSVIATTPGDRLELIDGEVVEGRIVRDEADRYTVEYRDEDADKMAQRTVMKKLVRDNFRNVPINAMALKNPLEVYEDVRKRYEPLDANDHYILVQYCKLLGLYNEGRTHIDEAISRKPELAERLEPIRQLFDDLEAQKEIRLRIDEASSLIRKGRYPLAESILESVSATQGIAVSLQALAAEKMAWLNENAQHDVSKQWYRLIEVLAGMKAKDLDLQQARQYATGQMNNDIIAEILDTLFKNIKEGDVDAMRSKWTNHVQELFNSRDKSKYGTIKVTVDLMSFEGRSSVSGNGSSGQGQGAQGQGQSQGDMRDQIRDMIKQIQENPDQADALRKQLQDMMKGMQGGGGRRAILPDDYGKNDEPGRWYSVEPSENLAQEGGGRNGGGRNNGGSGFQQGGNQQGGNQQGGRQNGGPNGQGAQGQPKKPTPQELWDKSGQMSRRNYIIYLYCERNPTIERLKDKERGGAVQLWYR